MIRPTVPEDTPSLVTLAEGTTVFKPMEIQALREVLDDYHAHEKETGHRCVTCQKEGKIIGFAYYAPAAATAQMVEAIVRDKKRLLPCAAYCDKEYGVGGYYVGVPVILGAKGVEKVIELQLDPQEKAAFENSVTAVKSLVKTMGELMAKA